MMLYVPFSLLSVSLLMVGCYEYFKVSSPATLSGQDVFVKADETYRI